MKRLRVPLGLLSIVLLAALLRAVAFFDIFPGDGSVEIRIHDSAYHARRALYSFVNFPAVLVFDPYIAYPDGAPVPMPPGFDWALAAIARLFGDQVSTFEHVTAWCSPIFGALTVLPVYALGRVLAGPALGLGAGLLFAVLPVAVKSAGLGDLDHHAAVALLAACWLLASLRLVDPRARPGPWWRACLGALLARSALVFCWSGSLLYLVLGDGVLLGLAILEARRRLLLAEAFGALGSALLLTPWLLSTGPSLGGAFATTTLSWFHVVLLASAGSTAAILAALMAHWGGDSLGRRLAWAAMVGLGVGGIAVLLIPELLEALKPGLSFLSKADTWGPRNLEQRAIFQLGGDGITGVAETAHQQYGLLAYAIPLGVVACALRAREPQLRAPALCLTAWYTVLGSLALLQMRFGADFAPLAAVGFALLLRDMGAALTRRVPSVPALPLVLLVATGLLAPGLASYLWRVPSVLAQLAGGREEPEGPRRLRGTESLARFARRVGEVTPETSGFLDADGRPEYGILCIPSHGHTLHYMARRATPADNFGPWLDAAKYRAVRFFYGAATEAEALAIAQSLRTRYVLSFDQEGEPSSFIQRLHRWDGLGPDARGHVERLRLIIEGPKRGQPLVAAFPSRLMPRGTVPYKLYEIVPGAVLAVHGEPGAAVEVGVGLISSIGRRFRYRAEGSVGEDGVARIRVPYATETREPTRPVAPYRVRVGGRELRVPVSDAQLRAGAVIPVGASSNSRTP